MSTLNFKYKELEELVKHFEAAWGMDIDSCDADDGEELTYTQYKTWPVSISFLYTATGETISLGCIQKDGGGLQNLVTFVEEGRYDLELAEMTKAVRVRLAVDERKDLLRLFVFCC